MGKKYKMEWHDFSKAKAKNHIDEIIEKRLRLMLIAGMIIGAIATIIVASVLEKPEVRYECTWEEKSKYCMPYLEDANDNYEYALSLLDECEAKTVPPLDNSEMLKWKAKYNNIVPLYQKCDKDFRNFTNYHNMYFVDYRYLGFNCNLPVERTNTIKEIQYRDVYIEVPPQDEWDGDYHHGEDHHDHPHDINHHHEDEQLHCQAHNNCGEDNED